MTPPRFPSSLRSRLIAFVLVTFLLFALIVVFIAIETRQFALAESDRLFARTLILLGLVGMSILALAWQGIGALILRPIEKLMSAIERLSQADFSARTGLAEGGDEIARLGQAFDAMAAALEQRETGRREAETQLQESERRYRRLVELSPEAILVRTGDEIAFVNPAAARLLGAADPAQVIGQRFWDFIHPEAQTAARERLQQSDAGQPPSHSELKFQRLDETTFEAEVSVSSLTYRGRPATQVVVRDITERKQIEATLRESEERFRTMADNAPVLIWVAEPDGLRKFFNKPWLDFTGRTLEQEVGSGWTDGVHPDDYQRYLDAYIAAVKARQSYELEYRLRRADGTYRWLVGIGVPRFTPDDRLADYIGICLDITERHEAENALRLSRDQFAIILQGAADGIVALDRTGRLRYANDAAAHLIGYPSAEALLAAPPSEILQKFEIYDEAGRLFPIDRLPARLVLQGMPQASATIRYRNIATGEEHWSIDKSTPVFNADGQVELAVNILHDITDFKRTEFSQHLLAEVGQWLATPLDNAARLADVAHLAVPLLADWCAMDVVGEDGSLQRAAVAGTDSAKAAMAEGHPFELDAPHGAARVVQTGKPELDPFIPDSYLSAVARDDAHLRALRELDLKSAIVMPLMARGRPMGALTFVWVNSRRRYSRADLALAEELARRVALALDNVRLYYEAQKLNASLEQRVNTRTAQLLAINTQLESEVAERKEAQRQLEESQARLRRLSAHLQAAREEERIRIAREIHDELGQALAGLKMDVAWLQRSQNRPVSGIAPKLEDMSALIDATVQAVRRISAELRPSLLDDLGLAAAIEWQLDEFRERTSLQCIFTSNLKNTVLDTDHATALFRIFQEALTNVARHANATQVTVNLTEDPDSLTLHIRDNGRGISEEEMRQAKSFGLLGMRERVYFLEGEIDIRGAPAQGTIVTVRIPLKKELGS